MRLGLARCVWQGRQLGPFRTCIWEISKQMHMRLHFLGRRAENLRILGGELRLLWNLNPSWKRHERAPIKNVTFLPPFGVCCWVPFILVAFQGSSGDFLCEWVISTGLSSRGSVLFLTMISISSESIVTAKDVSLYSESTISRDEKKKNCLRAMWG